MTFLERGMGLLSKLEGMDPETQEAKQEAAEFQVLFFSFTHRIKRLLFYVTHAL